MFHQKECFGLPRGSLPGYSQVRLSGGTSFGSTATAIRCFTTILRISGPDIVYRSDSVNGDSFTIASDGIYAMQWVDAPVGDTNVHELGFSVNSTQLTTEPSSCALSTIITFALNTNSTTYVNASATWPLYAGDIIRAHATPGELTSNTSSTLFSIVRVA